MNETKLKRISNHIQNRPRDKRMALSSTIDEHMERLKEESNEKGMVDFMLKAVPFIKQYSESGKRDGNAADTCNDDVTQFINQHGTTKKGKVYKDFMETCMNIVTEDEGSAPLPTQMKCVSCNGDKVYVIAEAQLVCESCGVSEDYQDFGLSIYTNVTTCTNGEIIMQFPYKRINHFREWLSQVQGRENTCIPEHVIVAVMKELKKERIYDESLITQERVKRYLKKNGYSKYYEHVPSIMNRICRKPCVSISYETEQVLIEKFYEIQECFEKYRPKKRKNFMSYSYTLHKLCELIGRNDLVALFPLLKSRSKLRVQDEIWEKICIEKGWKFIRSV